MAPKRIEWSAEVERRVRKLAAGGKSAKAIAAMLAEEGVPGANQATVGRRLRELVGDRRSSKKARRPRARPEPAEEPIAEMPEGDAELDGQPIGLLKHWHREAIQGHAIAKQAGNLASMARFADSGARCAAAIMRASPPPVEDPNLAPDIKAAAAEGRRLFLETFGNLVRARAL